MEESLVDLCFIKIYKLLWRKHTSKKYVLCSGYVVSGFDNKEHKEVDNCLHKNCPECHGSGIKLNGEICIHMISCPCPRCAPRC